MAAILTAPDPEIAAERIVSQPRLFGTELQAVGFPLVNHFQLFRSQLQREVFSAATVDHRGVPQPVTVVNYHDKSVNIRGNVQGSNVAVAGSNIAGSSASNNNAAVKFRFSFGSGLATLFNWIRRFIVWLWAWL